MDEDFIGTLFNSSDEKKPKIVWRITHKTFKK
jgi:hypothetical protein